MVTGGIEAWRDLAGRLSSLAEELGGAEYADADPVELLAHLGDQVVCWLSWSVFHDDPARPFFHRQNDLVTQWGGPNADNVYRHARVDRAHRYRLTGKLHGCEDFVLAVRAGFMHEPVHGTLREYTASDLGIGEGDDFVLTIGAEGCDIELPEGAVMVSIREYYWDWRPIEPATMVIECLDPVGAAGPLDEAKLARDLDRSATAVEHSMRYWHRYLEDVRAAGPANEFAESIQVAKGLQLARYGFCHFDLAPGEALLVDTDVADARYWSLHLYPLGTFEHVDLLDRVTSLNHRQVALDGDGRIRLVVAAEDPEVANWLDTGGRQRGLLTYRWFWPRSDAAPAPQARVVPVAEAAAALGSTAPVPDRAEVLAARRAHLAWRFRV